MDESDQIARRGPRRWFHFLTEALLEGAVGVWRSATFIVAFAIGASYLAVIGAGVAVAAIINVAWVFAAAFLLLFVVAAIGGYRVWSRTERDLAAAHAATEAAERQLETAQTPVVYATGGAGGSGFNAGGGGGIGVGPGSVGEGGKGGAPGVSAFEILARASLGMGYPLDEFIRMAGFDPGGDALERIGGDGGSAGPDGAEAGQAGGDGLAVIEALDAARQPMQVSVFHADGSQFTINRKESSSEDQGTVIREPPSGLREDRDVGIKLESGESTDAVREE